MQQTPNVENNPETEMLQGNIEERGSFDLSFQQHHDRSQKLKRDIRILRFVSRLGGTVLAIATLCLEARTLALFVRTRNTQEGGRGPWARQTILWPSILLASASAVTVLIGFFVIGAYTLSIRAANKVNVIQTTVVIIIELTHIVVWIVVAVLYRKGKTGHDLWGWSCSPAAQKIQPNFKDVVNFEDICHRGATNWALSILNPAFIIFNLSIWYLVWQRRTSQKLTEKIRQQQELESKGIPSPALS